MDALWNEPHGRRMRVGPEETHLWRIRLWPAAVCPETFSSQESARVERFRSEQARQRYISSHIAMRDILARYLKIPPRQISIVQPEMRKPFLASHAGARAVSFSLSRSENLCLMAIASSVQAGVDIECLRPERYEAGMEQLIFTADEKAALETIDPAERWRAFLRGWTRKEAYAKCIGLGLAADLSHAELGLTEETVRVQGITVSSFAPQEGFLAAWAAEEALRPSFWNWSP